MKYVLNILLSLTYRFNASYKQQAQYFLKDSVLNVLLKFGS